MLRLRTLGGLSIAADDSPLSGAAARRRSLALLALAASAGEAGVSDEQALALLWPDSDSAHARNNLKQVVFTLRHSLERDVFLRSATTLRLDPAMVSVDRADFEGAVVEGDAARAINLYSGPFLHGFHISGLAEFERWVEAERGRLARFFMDALTRLAVGADAAGDYLDAIAWWRKLVTQDPLSDVNAQKLIRALAASGDTAGALQHARVHETLVSQELDLKPSPAFQRFVEDIRAGILPTNGATTSSTRVTTPPFAVQAIPMATTVRAELPHHPPGGGNGLAPQASEELPKRTVNAPEPRNTGDSAPVRKRRAWHTAERRIAGFTTRLTVAAIALVVVGAVATIAVRQSGPLFTADSGRGSAVVVPSFAVNAGTGAANLGAVVSELLATSLDGSLGLRALAVGWNDRRSDSVRVESPVERRARAQRLATNLGANLYVSGEVFESGDRVRITAEFRSRQDEAPLDRAVVEGTRSELFDLVDRVASQLLASRIEGGRRDVVRVASVTTSSLPAAKAYFNGEAALAAGSFRAAIDAYREALQLDPSFALAHYGLSNAADMLGDDALVQRAASQALQYAQRLPSRQKRLLAAFLARNQGDVAGAKRLYSQLTTDYPADAEAWLGLGETLFHLNPLDGQPVTEAGSAFERASVLDPKNIGAFVHLARIAALEGDEDRSRQMVARARALAPDAAVARFALHVLSLGVPFDDPLSGRARTAVTGLPAADAVALLTRAGMDDFLRFATRLAAGGAREYGLRLQSLVEAGHGRIIRAMALLDTCSASNQSLAIEARSRLAALSFFPVEAGEIERVRSEVLVWTPDIHAIEDPIDSVAHVVTYPYIRLHRLGLLSLRLNDTAAVQALAGQLDDMAEAAPSNASAQLLAASLRAHLAATRGRPREALALLEGPTASRVTSATSLEAYDRLLFAQLLEQRGRDDEALGYYSQMGSRSPFEFAFVWQAELGMARIHSKRGERTLAAGYYRSVAARLKDADSTLRQVRDDAERLAASVIHK